MTYRKPARTRPNRNPRILVAGFLVLITTVAGTLGYRSLSSSCSTGASPGTAHRSEQLAAPGETDDRTPSSPTRSPASDDCLGALGEADGVVPDGVTVFDDEYPAVANLDPALLRALRQAATDASDDGIVIYVNSGWRSSAYQEQLLDEAILKYGSREKAARWVGTPTGSAHVSGDAADIGRQNAMEWLSKHGGQYGLYQIYRNEPWHFELRADGRPRMYADPTHDPRMQ